MQARYLRFFAPTTPGPALLDLLCGGDGTADAVLAIRDAVIIGHAMAADRSGPGGARMTDIGVVVADAWQGKGVGSALVRALMTRAQARGVTSVTMDVLHGNHRALAMIAGHWPGACTRRTRDYEAILVPVPVPVPHGRQRRPRARPARPGTRQSAPMAAAGRVLPRGCRQVGVVARHDAFGGVLAVEGPQRRTLGAAHVGSQAAPGAETTA
jgi:GNAT superfamily N-acetyltransferase